MDTQAVTFANYVTDQMVKTYPPNATWEAELTGIPAFLPLMRSRFVCDSRFTLSTCPSTLSVLSSSSPSSSSPPSLLLPDLFRNVLYSIEKDFALMDGIVLPIAIIFLAIILKSLRLLVREEQKKKWEGT
jgi:hypothetical protein